MSILPSVSSAKSLLSPEANDYFGTNVQSSPGISSPALQTRLLPFLKLQNETVMTSDEIFTKYTVADVKIFQKRLRADADAKQQELRLMVGERYRDLLQASSAIISIANSSKRVLEAIEESKDAILSQDDLPLPPKTATVVDDKHLHSLQTLSSHVRLLLDAPEHLWRLIERKKYLQAAWLFLLSSVVHRALISGDENEQSWVEDCVEVKRDFPLVQRQWEVVSQFRSQIIHKSTLSLRDTFASSEDICATLVTLHLLDSRPLNETLTTLLLQRSKTLQSALSWKSDVKRINKENAVQTDTYATKSVSRETTQVMKDALIAITQTMYASRAVFHQEAGTSSLLFRVLESIQSESENPERFSNLPTNLQLSTQGVLGQLTSSASFQLLPTDLRSYRPYVDLGSSSASLTQYIFAQKLQEWFQTSCERWQSSSSKWLSGISVVKEVWALRTSIKRLITTSGINEEEKGYLSSNLDSLCHVRIIDIWEKTLLDGEVEFRRRLRLQVFAEAEKLSTADFLFSPTPIPVSSQTKSPTDTPFQKYHFTLKQQLFGRSAQFNNVLSVLEESAWRIRNDFSIITATEEEKIRSFVETLRHTYQPTANALLLKIVDALHEVATDLMSNADTIIPGLVFLIRTTDVLCSSSSLTENIGCSEEVLKDEVFQQRLASISSKTLEKWRDVTVNRIVDEARPLLGGRRSQGNGPSHALLHSLLELAQGLQNLGLIFHPARQQAIIPDALRHLFRSLLHSSLDAPDEAVFHDLAFIRKISELYGPTWTDILEQVDQRLRAASFDKVDDVLLFASDYLLRSQTLLSILLPAPTTPNFDVPLLQFGVPSGRQILGSTADLAKPSPRFGMLLVGKTETMA